MWVKVAAGSTVVVVSLVLMWFVVRLPAITIASVEVKGTSAVSADALKSIAEEKLNGSYAFLIPHRNSLVFPKQKIESAITDALPPLAKITISRNGFNALTITAEERMAVALWCESTSADVETVSSDVGAPCYSMDKNGFIFASADNSSALVRFYGVIPGTPISSTYLGGDFASLNTLVTDIASSINRIPNSVAVDTESNDVVVALKDGGLLKFVRTSDRLATLANIASVFASQSFKANKEFEYVDFRFGDKVYVKFRGQ